MKLSSLLLILVMCKLAKANKSELNHEDPGNFTPALFFVDDTKFKQFYIVPDNKYDEYGMKKREEILSYTCPASQGEIKKLKDFELLKKKDPTLASAPSQTSPLTKSNSKSPQLIPSSSKNGKKSSTPPSADQADPKASPKREEKLSSPSSLSSKNGSDSAEDESSSDEEDEQIQTSLDNSKEEKIFTYDHDYFFNLGEILNELASEMGVKNILWPTKNYVCKKDFRPQRATFADCARFKTDEELEEGQLYSISYKVKKMENDKEVRGELFVYAKCFKHIIQKTYFVMYKIIPTVPAEKPEQIDYETFDPTTVYPKDVYLSYVLNDQKDFFKEFDDKIEDGVIPQRLIPVYSIAENYARGTVANDGDIISPQWRSKAEIWDELSRKIFNHGKKLAWIIYTGTVGTLLTSKGKPMELKRKKIPIRITIPLHWWTLIMKTNSKKGEGIIISMLNYPKTDNPELPDNIGKLCGSSKACFDYGWGDIITEKNANYVVCCKVNGTTSRSLIAYPMELNVLSLDSEKTKEYEYDWVRVDNLMRELFSINDRYRKWKKKNNVESADSPVSTPSPNLENSESPTTSPLGSPDRRSETASPRSSDEAKELLTESKSRSRFHRFLPVKKLSVPKPMKSVMSLVRSPIKT